MEQCQQKSADQVAGHPAGRKRCSFLLPQAVCGELQRSGASQGTTVAQVIRGFIRLGLRVIELQDTPGAALIIRERDRERVILFL